MKILAFSGSTRKDSYNKKLLKIAADAARDAGAEVTVIDLKDFPMPLYDADLEKEKGMPENGRKLMDLMIENHGFLISSPEYNSSFSGVLKNAIDWASRPLPGIPALAAFDGKVAVLMSASTGVLGGLRGLYSLRQMLSNIRVLVLPDQIGVMKAGEAFDEQGNLKDEKKHESIQKLGIKLYNTIVKLNPVIK